MSVACGCGGCLVGAWGGVDALFDVSLLAVHAAVIPDVLQNV